MKCSWRWLKIMFIDEKTVNSQLYPGVVFKLKRVSLGQRLRFLSDHSADLGQLNFMAASVNESMTESRMTVELEICKSLLKLCVLGVGEGLQGNESIEAWLIESAPQDLCMELIRLVLDEFLLSSDRAKN
jgi:hypothetical protein